MTRALLLLALALPASAWELQEGAGVEERAHELAQVWRPYNGTMVDRDMVKRSAQEEQPDWVTREKEKMTPAERPFGRVHGFTMRRDDVRFVMLGRFGPLREKPTVKELVYALRMAEGAAVQTFWQTMSKTQETRWELASSAPGRDAYSSPASLQEAEKVRVTWHPLDFYRDQGDKAEFYVLFYADKPRAGASLPSATKLLGEPSNGRKGRMRFLRDR